MHEGKKCISCLNEPISAVIITFKGKITSPTSFFDLVLQQMKGMVSAPWLYNTKDAFKTRHVSRENDAAGDEHILTLDGA